MNHAFFGTEHIIMGEMFNRGTYIGEYTLFKSITAVCVELYSFDVATRTSSNQSILVG